MTQMTGSPAQLGGEVSALASPRPTLQTDNRGHALAPDARLPPVVAVSHLRWDFVFQRPQHLLTRVANAAQQVLYIEEPIFEDRADISAEIIDHLEGRLAVVRLHLPHSHDRAQISRLQGELIASQLAKRGIADYVLWAYAPPVVDMLPFMPFPQAIVFDVMDELSAFRGAPPELLDQEARLLEIADVVFTGGQSLYDAKAHRHQNIHCFPSAIEREHFAVAKTLKELPPEYADSMPRATSWAFTE